jgi:hypothetical protein
MSVKQNLKTWHYPQPPKGGQLAAAITYLPTTQEYYRGLVSNPNLAKRNFAGQDVDLEEIQLKIALQDILGTAQKYRSLRDICLVAPVDKIAGRADAETIYVSSAEKVKEMEEPEFVKQEFTSFDYLCDKNLVEIKIADEAKMQFGHNFLELQKREAAAELARFENKQIAEIAETAETVEGHDWGDATDGINTNNPAVDLAAAIDEIDAKFSVDFLAANSGVWLDYFTNSFIRGASQGNQPPSEASFPVPALPGVKGISHGSFTKTLGIIGSSVAPGLILIDGPVEAALYRDELAGAWIYKLCQYLEPLLVVPNGIREISGVHG